MAKEDGGDDDGGEQRNTRFPCLAMTRTLVATVVSVLAAVVVVMVIIVLNRPEKIDLFINYGYIQAEQMWWNKTQVTTSAAEASQVDPCVLPVAPHLGSGGGRGSEQMIAHVRSSRASTTARDDIVGDCDGDLTTTEYNRVTKVVLHVAVSAYNPSKRRNKVILCNVTTVRILDVNASYTGVAIASLVFPPEDKDHFIVQPEGTFARHWTLPIEDNSTLEYLNDMYQQRTSFTTMVQLDVAYSDKIGNISFYCHPVTLGYGVPSTTKLYDTTPCKSSAEMVGDKVTWYPPPQLSTNQ